MKQFTVVCGIGIESILSREINDLGCEVARTENGRVTLNGDWKDMIRLNLWSRTADRVYWNAASFAVKDYEDLFTGIRGMPWPDLLPGKARILTEIRSSDNHVKSGSSGQAVIKKAIVESLKRKYKVDWLDETGPEVLIEVWVKDGLASVLIDTSGESLHRRGYRTEAVAAPLRETLAASVILLSRWRPEEVFADPLCGSGTLAIEAAMIATNSAPGLHRRFAAESYPFIAVEAWKYAREHARHEKKTGEWTILASDMSYHAIRMAVHNAERAGVQSSISFQKKPLNTFSSKRRTGWIVTNPPYGERISNPRDAVLIYDQLGQLYRQLDNWRFFILTSHDQFEKYFGKKSDKNRKLYNGKLKCYVYQYFKSDLRTEKKT